MLYPHRFRTRTVPILCPYYTRTRDNNKDNINFLNLTLEQIINSKQFFINKDQEKGLNELPNYIHEINVQGTRRIAEIASLKNVKRFIFISTAKVFGEISFSGKPFKT